MTYIGARSAGVCKGGYPPLLCFLWAYPFLWDMPKKWVHTPPPPRRKAAHVTSKKYAALTANNAALWARKSRPHGGQMIEHAENAPLLKRRILIIS